MSDTVKTSIAPSSLDVVDLRPSERVVRYLLQEFDRPELEHGARLPSNRELARRLKVSVPTIQSVLRRLDKEGRVKARRGSGTFLVAKQAPQTETLKIVLASPLQMAEEQDPFLHAIFAGLMTAVLQSKQPITLRGYEAEEVGNDASINRLLRERATAHGLIVIPFTLYPEDRNRITALYEQSGKPVVQLHPPDIKAMTNFVSPDYLDNCFRVGEAWRRSGRRRIGFLATDLNSSISARLRHMGLTSGLQLGANEATRFCVMENSQQTEKDGSQAFRYFTEKMKGPPDAVYCMNAGVALGVMRAAKKAGVRVPEDMSVVSDTGFDPIASSNPKLTRFNEPLHEVGRLLLETVCERIGKNQESVTGKFLSAPLVGGGTTLPEENEVLEIPLVADR